MSLAQDFFGLMVGFSFQHAPPTFDELKIISSPGPLQGIMEADEPAQLKIFWIGKKKGMTNKLQHWSKTEG
ncbi:MAG: hypothetical protein QF560_04545, partial [SAR324 cluster bacterium]|nr:hypothetical protein [SAR324 cluster bacterium]